MFKEYIEKIKTENNIELVQKLTEINDGYITSKQLTELGIHRMYLKIMIDKGMLERINKGIYINKKTMEDVYYTLQLRYPKIIYSRFTALYFYGLTEMYPHSFDITVDYNYHVNTIDQKHMVIKCKKEIFELGLTTIKTPLGHKVRCYDRERCICDLIKYRNRLDMEQVKKSVRMYIKDQNKNLSNLTEYSKKMGINEDVMDFVGMFYE